MTNPQPPIPNSPSPIKPQITQIITKDYNDKWPMTNDQFSHEFHELTRIKTQSPISNEQLTMYNVKCIQRTLRTMKNDQWPTPNPQPPIIIVMLNLFQHQKDYEINTRNKLSVTKLKTPSPLERGYGGEAQINRINSVLRKFIGSGVRLINRINSVLRNSLWDSETSSEWQYWASDWRSHRCHAELVSASIFEERKEINRINSVLRNFIKEGWG